MKEKSPPIASLITTTIGGFPILSRTLIIFLGSEKRASPPYLEKGTVMLGNSPISITQIMMFVVSVLLMGILMFIVFKTKIGLAMRACTNKTRRRQHLMGSQREFYYLFHVFPRMMFGNDSRSIGKRILQIVYPNMGFMAGLKAFAAAVLGGIGSCREH